MTESLFPKDCVITVKRESTFAKWEMTISHTPTQETVSGTGWRKYALREELLGKLQSRINAKLLGLVP